MRLIPGDICVVRLASGGGTFNAHAVELCHAEVGLDRPVVVQFPRFPLGPVPVRFRRIDVVRQAGVVRDPRSAADFTGDRDPGDRGSRS
ncbi:MAG: hypothetical protein WDO24_05275 [Pseudomonadota bacterium]